MKNFFIYIILSIFFINIESNSNESNPYKDDFEEVFNIGKMLSHDKKFTLFFKSREKAVLAKGKTINYITDYPQDLYILYNNTGKIGALITYDWFPKQVKNLSLNSNLPVFPEDYAYYLLNDNETLVMISGVKSIRSNFIFNLNNNTLKILPNENKYNLFVSSLLRDCGFKNINSTYKCSYYKPLISFNLIN